MLASLAVVSPWLFLVYLTRSADTNQHQAWLDYPLRVTSRRLLSNTLPTTQQVCSVCGTAFEGNMNEVMEMQESMLVGITRRRVKKDKVDRPALLL